MYLYLLLFSRFTKLHYYIFTILPNLTCYFSANNDLIQIRLLSKLNSKINNYFRLSIIVIRKNKNYIIFVKLIHYPGLESG